MNLTKIFVNQNRWLKDGFAQYKNGAEYKFTHAWKDNPPEPYKFSLHGAIAYFTEPESGARQKVVERLSRAIERYTGKRMRVAEFNNSPDTSFEDLTNVIKIYSTIR